PFNTPWRTDKGALWDLGPHAIALLRACLGPVSSLTADAGLADVTHLVLHHQGGATSTVTVSQSVSPAAESFGCYVWGAAGRAAEAGVTSTVVIQTAAEPWETPDLLALAAGRDPYAALGQADGAGLPGGLANPGGDGPATGSGLLAGVVGWTDLAAPTVADAV